MRPKIRRKNDAVSLNNVERCEPGGLQPQARGRQGRSAAQSGEGGPAGTPEQGGDRDGRADRGERPTVLFIGIDLQPVGGGGAVAAWMLQALLPLYRVTVLTWEAPRLRELDELFGTTLADADLRVLTPPPVARWLVELIPDTSDFQKANYLLRMGKQRHEEFDLVIESCMEADLGRPGIQYVHYPYLVKRRGSGRRRPVIRRERGWSGCWAGGSLPGWPSPATLSSA